MEQCIEKLFGNSRLRTEFASSSFAPNYASWRLKQSIKFGDDLVKGVKIDKDKNHYRLSVLAQKPPTQGGDVYTCIVHENLTGKDLVKVYDSELEALRKRSNAG